MQHIRGRSRSFVVALYFSKQVRDYFISQYGLLWNHKASVKEHLESWLKKRERKQEGKFGRFSQLQYVWALWMERNSIVMAGERHKDKDGIINEVKKLTDIQMGCNSKLGNLILGLQY